MTGEIGLEASLVSILNSFYFTKPKKGVTFRTPTVTLTLFLNLEDSPQNVRKSEQSRSSPKTSQRRPGFVGVDRFFPGLDA